MHGLGASNSGAAGGEAKWKNTEISTPEGGPAPPGPPIVGNPDTYTHTLTLQTQISYVALGGTGEAVPETAAACSLSAVVS